MKTRVDERLRVEAARFVFRFACENCAHFAGEGAGPASARGSGDACSLGFPPAPRPAALGDPELELCKSFELV